MANNRKYIFVNGMPVVNPAYQDPTAGAQSATASPSTTSTAANSSALTIVTTIEDQAAMAQLTSLPAPKQFQDTINAIQSDDYVAGFQAQNLNGATVMDGLMKVFAQNEIPIGLMSKVTPLQGATLHFKIDNSGSMANRSNLLLSDACWYTRQMLNINRRHLTRWEEAEDRMHTLIELLAYVPTGPIILSFFDHDRRPGDRITLDRTGKMPDDFLRESHAAIRKLFSREPDGNTPIYRNLQNMLNEANVSRKQTDNRTMHYLLSDGEPNDGAEEIRWIKDLLRSPDRFASSNPLTFLGCSNQREDYAWMHELEEIAPYVAALPDYKDESLEVKNDQGSAFPYSRGFWLLCNIAASINPDDLDALDQHEPLTKATMENLMGRGLTTDEYQQYFNRHPNATRVFGPDYDLFLTAIRAIDIPAVKLFKDTIAKRLAIDMDRDNDDTEAQELRYAERVVLNSRAPVAPTVTVSKTPATLYYDSSRSSSSSSSSSPVYPSARNVTIVPSYDTQQRNPQTAARPKRRGGCTIC